MNHRINSRCVLQFQWATVVLLITLLVAIRANSAAGDGEANAIGIDEEHRRMVDVGHDLFIHTWQFGDKQSGGDGLGPMFNERSCVACHNQGGVGGGGPNEKNVQILSLVLGTISLDGATLKSKVGQVHPGLAENPGGVVLHKFCHDIKYVPWRRQRLTMATTVGSPLAFAASNFRPDLMNFDDLDAIEDAAERGRLFSNSKSWVTDVQRVVDREHRRNGEPIPSFKLVLTERNTPAIFGAGLIDQVTDAQIEQQEAIQAGRNIPTDGLGLRREPPRRQRMTVSAGRTPIPVAGRAARLPDGRIGRFGWKGQNASLKDFTLDACAVELGLQTQGRPQAQDPRDLSHKPPEVIKPDLNDTQSEALVAFLVDLPAPRPMDRLPEKSHAADGSALFTSTGCADCHVQTVGSARNIYSDLLLHDMGKRLTGPTYYGVARARLVASPVALAAGSTEWRTPPLWGCRDSAPYMHDGRSLTLEAAILEHDGEAANSATRYEALTPSERAALVEFLGTLAAPKGTELLRDAHQRVPIARVGKKNLPH